MLLVRMHIVNGVSERCQAVVLKIISRYPKDNGEPSSQIATLELESQTTVPFLLSIGLVADGLHGEFVHATSTGPANPGKLHLATD